MTVFSGLPTHVLMVHFLVVLVPLTAVLEILCALWPAVRRGQVVWLTLALATVIMVLTPITVEAGEWLYDLRHNPSPILQQHAARGAWMTYFAVALLVVAIALAALQVIEGRSDEPRRVAKAIVAVLAVVVGSASLIQIYRIGDTGARAVWGNEIARLRQITDKK